MVSWIWIPACIVIGCMIGFFLIALMEANDDVRGK